MNDPKKPRIGLLIVTPTIQQTAPAKEAWFKCLEQDCGTIFTRARDLSSHKKEKKKACTLLLMQSIICKKG